MEYTTLKNGVKMPLLGFGVFQVPEGEVCEESVYNALAAGYRLIDTAAVYSNEAAVGRAIRRSGVPREELFVTTKLWVQDQGYEAAKKAVTASLERLGLDYLDLYLIHQPFGDVYGSWRAMEELYKAGTLRAIGVCNFTDTQLADLAEFNEIAPMVNQIELHPYSPQFEREDIHKQYGVQLEAWGPLAEAKNGIFENKILVSIAGKYGKSVAQVILRWHLQRGVAAIPKSVHKERIDENINIFDFTLSAEDMTAIAALDTGAGLYGSTFNSPASAKMLRDIKIHD